eukprot:255282-Pyramimonas_sp.AAC.4
MRLPYRPLWPHRRCGSLVAPANLTAEGTIPDDIFKKACVSNAEEAVSTAERVGYPIMVKASEGGGGKGIRMVADPAKLKDAYLQFAPPPCADSVRGALVVAFEPRVTEKLPRPKLFRRRPRVAALGISISSADGCGQASRAKTTDTAYSVP